MLWEEDFLPPLLLKWLREHNRYFPHPLVPRMGNGAHQVRSHAATHHLLGTMQAANRSPQTECLTAATHSGDCSSQPASRRAGEGGKWWHVPIVSLNNVLLCHLSLNFCTIYASEAMGKGQLYHLTSFTTTKVHKRWSRSPAVDCHTEVIAESLKQLQKRSCHFADSSWIALKQTSVDSRLSKHQQSRSTEFCPFLFEMHCSCSCENLYFVSNTNNV